MAPRPVCQNVLCVTFKSARTGVLEYIYIKHTGESVCKGALRKSVPSFEIARRVFNRNRTVIVFIIYTGSFSSDQQRISSPVVPLVFCLSNLIGKEHRSGLWDPHLKPALSRRPAGNVRLTFFHILSPFKTGVRRWDPYKQFLVADVDEVAPCCKNSVDIFSPYTILTRPNGT